MMRISIDHNQSQTQNIQVSDIFSALLQTTLVHSHINQYVLDGRLYRVYAQQKEQCAPILTTLVACVRSLDGNLVQLHGANGKVLSAVVTHNVYPSIKIQELQRRATWDKTAKRLTAAKGSFLADLTTTLDWDCPGAILRRRCHADHFWFSLCHGLLSVGGSGTKASLTPPSSHDLPYPWQS